ncbi:hypothetical protein [Roseobacter fucihabitans]|nr:hypothetical protein [Roseobacter litoralis]MBC6964168.1 hypothetical protein [Roseobacter litoralis]
MFGVIGVSDVVEVFSGLMNTINVADNADNSSVTLLLDSKLLQLERARIRRYTHESQQTIFPHDSGLSFVTNLADKEVVWGRAGLICSFRRLRRITASGNGEVDPRLKSHNHPGGAYLC